MIDALFRSVNALIILFSHPILLSNTKATKTLTPCLLDCLNSSLFLHLSTKFLRQNSSSEKIPIRSVFLLFTCLDYCTLSTTTTTLQLIPSIRKILHLWCEIAQNSDEDTSPLIIRLVRLINRLALSNKDSIIQENLCAFLVPHFEKLCFTSTVIDDLVSLFLTLSTTLTGKRHLRRLGYVQLILHVTKRYTNFWHPLALLINQRDLCQSSLFKRIIHLLAQRTVNIFQSLATASNDTSFDSTTPSTKNHAAFIAIEWLSLLRTNFLSFLIIVDELIRHTKKANLINMLLDTIISLQQDDESLPKLIDVMIELLWTFAFSTSTSIQETLQIRSDINRWLKINLTNSSPSIQLASQAILALIDPNSRLTNKISNSRSSSISNHFVCLLNSDETHQEWCITLRDRLQNEHQYSVELILTPSCESLDSLMYLVEHSFMCIFCASTRMKTDNLAHLVHRFVSLQADGPSISTIFIENDCELEGNWLESLPIVDVQSIHMEIRRVFEQQFEENDLRLPSRTSDASTISHSRVTSPDEMRNQSRNYMNCPVPYWSAEDVSEWCEATQGSFETLQPLVMRLNGSALVHLAEILSIDPASMYHSLNDELLQRTGSTVPLTEYVSLRSELQQLLVQKPNSQILVSPAATPDDSNRTNSRKRRWRNSRLCTML